jgi:hypothetical protein
MDHDEILRVRAERIKAFQGAAGGGTAGVVPPGMAAFLLAVSASRIRALLLNGRLETIAQGGQRWILFDSICKYAEAGDEHKPTARVISNPMATKSPKSVAPKSAMSKSGVPKSGMSKLSTPKSGMSKLGTTKLGMSKSVMS